MKDVSKLKDYRLKYKRYYDIDFDDDYVVHHIDEDRTNNDISNLVLLPKKLHSKYHFQKSIIESQSLVTTITGNGLHGQSYYLTCLESFMDTLRECNQWYDYKLYLEGVLPNIHRLSLR